VKVIKNLFRRVPFSGKAVEEPADPPIPRLAPPLQYFTMDIVDSDGEYNDDAFYKDLDRIKKPYKVPEDYEEV